MTSWSHDDSLTEELPEECIFIPTNHSGIQYNGRWTSRNLHSAIEGAYSGSSFEFTVEDTSSIYVWLGNIDQALSAATANDSTALAGAEDEKMLLYDKQGLIEPSGLISLLVVIDGNQQMLLSSTDGKGLKLQLDNTQPDETHHIKMKLLDSHSIVHLKGLWLCCDEATYKIKPRPQEQTTALRHSPAISRNHSGKTDGGRIVKIIDDCSLPKILPGEHRHDFEVGKTSFWDHLIAGLLGLDAISLISRQWTENGSTSATSDRYSTIHEQYFRRWIGLEHHVNCKLMKYSGPYGTSLFRRPWMFSKAKSPDAIILNIGYTTSLLSSDLIQPGMAHHDSSHRFVNAYSNLIRSIRRVQHHGASHSRSRITDGYVYNSAPSAIPIFVLRPFHGALEHESQRVVQQLYDEGDRAIFWIDTTGWLDEPAKDFTHPPSNGTTMDPQKPHHLTRSAHTKVASYLYSHLCLYLAADTTACPFLRHDTYVGKAYLPETARFEMTLEESKIQKLMQRFWDTNV